MTAATDPADPKGSLVPAPAGSDGAPSADDKTWSYLELRTQGLQAGLLIECVDRLVDFKELTTIRASSVGAILRAVWKGKIYSVADLRSAGTPPARRRRAKAAPMAVLIKTSHGPLLVVAEAVGQLKEFAADSLCSLDPPPVAPGGIEWLLGCTLTPQGLVLLLDTDSLGKALILDDQG